MKVIIMSLITCDFKSKSTNNRKNNGQIFGRYFFFVFLCFGKTNVKNELPISTLYSIEHT